MIVPASEPSVQAETILLVEDEVLIRFALADYLRSCGYQVIEAANAEEALMVLHTNQRIDLVFSDVRIPGSMDGFGLARWIRANRRHIKVVLSSGATRSAQLAGELCELGPVEAKPYHPQRLLERIRMTLSK